MKPLLIITLVLLARCKHKPEAVKSEPFQPAHFDNNLHSWVLETYDTQHITFYGADKPIGSFGKSWYDTPQYNCEIDTVIIDGKVRWVRSDTNAKFYWRDTLGESEPPPGWSHSEYLNIIKRIDSLERAINSIKKLHT